MRQRASRGSDTIPTIPRPPGPLKNRMVLVSRLASSHYRVPRTRGRTFPAGPTAPTPTWEQPGARAVSPGARYQPCEADQWRQIQAALESGIGYAMDKRGRRSSSARRSPSVDGDSTRSETQRRRVVSCGSRSHASGQVGPSTPRPAPLSALSPPPPFPVKPRGCWRVKKSILAALSHAPGKIPPANSGTGSLPNHDATRFGLQFNFVCKLSFFQQRLGQTYAP